MRIFRTALSMLTCLPAGRNFVPTEEEIRRTPFCFPLIGMVIGLVLAWIGMGVKMGDVISQERAEQLLKQDLVKFAKASRH